MRLFSLVAPILVALSMNAANAAPPENPIVGTWTLISAQVGREYITPQKEPGAEKVIFGEFTVTENSISVPIKEFPSVNYTMQSSLEKDQLIVKILDMDRAWEFCFLYRLDGDVLTICCYDLEQYQKEQHALDAGIRVSENEDFIPAPPELKASPNTIVAIFQRSTPKTAEFYDRYERKVVVAELPAQEPPRESGRVAISDLANLLGYWDVVHAPFSEDSIEQELKSGYRILFADKYKTPDSNGEQNWTIDETTEPRRIEFDLPEGKRKAIYKLQGDYLTLFYRDGSDTYPESFPSFKTSDEEGVLLILENSSRPEMLPSLKLVDEPLTLGEAEVLSAFRGHLTLRDLTELTPEVAGHLANGAGNLELPSLAGLSPETATALAGKKRRWLSLGLKSISPTAAAELAKSQCALRLRLQEISPEVAEALVSRTESLALSLSTLSPEIASVLTQYRGNHLYLEGVKALTPEAAVALQPYRGSHLDLSDLETLDLKTAEALVMVNSFCITMNGLKTISPEVAKVLVTRGATQSDDSRLMQTVSIQGLTELSDEVVEILQRNESERAAANRGGFLLPAKLYRR